MLLWWWEKRNMTIPKVFSDLVKKHPDKVAFYFNKQQWTFAKVWYKAQYAVFCGYLKNKV
jgi:hypothetical protein